MTNQSSIQQRLDQAELTVRRFVRRFQPSYKALACHAALPLLLTPELINYLRNEFLRDEDVPWVAEVDLLLSDLCHPVGYELYALDTDVRAYLLTEMEHQFGHLRMQQVAKLLISYVRYLAETNSQINEKELEAQQWAAMVYLDEPQRREAARQIAEKLELGGTIISQLGSNLVGQAELARLAQIAAELAPQLAEYPALLEYAALVRDTVLGDEVVAVERLERTYDVLPGYQLKLPEPLVRAAISRSMVAAEATETTARLPEFKTLEFETAQLVPDVTEEPEPDDNLPVLQTAEVEVVTIEILREPPPQPEIEFEPFTFEMATLERGEGFLRRWAIREQRQQAQRYIERLDDGGVFLMMVVVLGGTFVMGSPEDEPESFDNEGPQHDVRLSSFLMSQYPITQQQWRVVAAMPQQGRELNLDPSRFKGDRRPVENVSWYEAQEFCARLSAHTGREYGLPTEAEWEYACRAGTTTPFHFGETISPEVANYDGNYTYNEGPKGQSHGQTTSVDEYKYANAFGLCDMHGNVWEWCEDHYHSSYEGAPTDGSAWIDEDASKNKTRVRRGGSWVNSPGYCRSAYRYNFNPRGTIFNIGFRVVCRLPRSLP